MRVQIASLEGEAELVRRLKQVRVLMTDPLDGLLPGAEERGPLAELIMGGVYIGLGVDTSSPTVLWLGMPAPVTQEQLPNLVCQAVESAAGRPENTYRRFFAGVPVAFLAVDTDGVVLHCSNYFSRLGYDTAQIPGTDVHVLFADGEWERLRRNIHAAGQSKRFRTLLRSKKDVLVPVEFIASMLANEGELPTYMVMGCDLRLEQQLGHHRRLEAVGRLVSGVAHELNNPLQTVVGNAEMLAGMKLSDAAHRRAHRVLSGARRCQEVVDGLLKLTRKRRELSGTVQLEEVVRRASRRVQGEYGESVLQVEVVDPISTINGNPADLEQALENILRNAVQAVAGVSDPLAEVMVWSTDEAVQVAIKDNGGGMDSEAQDRAFEPFFTTRGVGGGKGLGLSIALGIIEEHGGTIELQPLTRGTQVLVILPC